MLEGMLDFFTAMVNMIYSAHESIVLTTQSIKNYDFASNPFNQYLGYARYVMGEPLYIGFVVVCTISLGFSLYQLVLRGIELFRAICKF